MAQRCFFCLAPVAEAEWEESYPLTAQPPFMGRLQELEERMFTCPSCKLPVSSLYLDEPIFEDEHYALPETSLFNGYTLRITPELNPELPAMLRTMQVLLSMMDDVTCNAKGITLRRYTREDLPFAYHEATEFSLNCAVNGTLLFNIILQVKHGVLQRMQGVIFSKYSHGRREQLTSCESISKLIALVEERRDHTA